MKNRKWFTVIIVIVLALYGIVTISAQDWPQWRDANRDGKVNDFTAPESWSPELSLQWQDSLGTGDATPVLVGDQEVILSLDADRGEEQWRMEYATPARLASRGFSRYASLWDFRYEGTRAFSVHPLRMAANTVKSKRIPSFMTESPWFIKNSGTNSLS
jgi:hypothetical protein